MQKNCHFGCLKDLYTNFFSCRFYWYEFQIIDLNAHLVLNEIIIISKAIEGLEGILNN